jgi:hypothetical protein
MEMLLDSNSELVNLTVDRDSELLGKEGQLNGSYGDEVLFVEILLE